MQGVKSTTSYQHRALIFVPSYNDTAHLPEIADSVRRLDGDHTLMLIDDGSTPAIDVASLGDDTLHFRLPANFGLGACTHIAFDHALRHDYSSVVRLDADGQHPVAAIPALLEPIRTGKAEVVVASRSNRDDAQGGRALASRLIRGYFTLVARLMTRGKAPADVNSGFFAASRTAIELLNSYQLERFPEPQTYVLACRRGLQLANVEVEQNVRQHGLSTVTVGQAIRLIYRFSIFVLAELLQRSSVR